ncbi:MAG TPA: 3-deoxy-manno-octulosonate cytidylyltransferase [Deltaproteobacteria bacterium]|nr:3-deoxy-manno-octulosonate cytidylyltransferase [Deltaproteobacteria bacterium]HPR56121.1 3-deoxy-manno-octulosonate cytidylyltransferase [Deltaproteobacteria bacterium]HXK48213.1 3-deoxy-manno-octulosonate cytidylyltransferase [Deltaproteobacteria bacterium]
MSVVAVIPARYGASRFPGKPLVDIAGKPMIVRIHEQVSACRDVDRVLVATDDERIFQAVSSFGGDAVMTSPDCPSGTDRVAQAVSGLDAEYIVNVQGDQVVLDLDALIGLVSALKAGSAMATIATAMKPDEQDDPNCVKVVCALNGDALYFSRSAIPFVRNPGRAGMLKHIGIYGFARRTLERFTSLSPSPLERTESLEQLRALENGIPIRVIVARGAFHEINTPQDLERLLSRWPAS